MKVNTKKIKPEVHKALEFFQANTPKDQYMEVQKISTKNHESSNIQPNH